MYSRGANRLRLAAALVVIALAAWSPALSAGAATTAPQVGKSFQLTRVSGTVTVTPPGAHAYTLTGTRSAPVGSTVDALNGVVRLTASNGHGGKYSGQFSKGSFKALQSRTGNSATEIKLVGCQPPAKKAGSGYHHHAHRSVRGTGASYHHGGHRYLAASVPPEFLVVGTNGTAQSSVGTSKFSLSENCAAGAAAAASQSSGLTTVAAQSGSVQASSANHRLKNSISAGEIDQLRCSKSAGYCLVDVVRLQGELRGFFFPAVATSKSAPTFQFCLTDPSKHRTCKPIVANGPVFENGVHLTGGLNVVNCQATQKGTYSVTWKANGVQLGGPLSFHLSSVPKRSFHLPCEAYLGNFDAQPGRQYLPTNAKVVSRLSLPIGVTIANMSVDLAPTGAPGTEYVQGVIYKARPNGAPGALVAYTKARSFTANSPADNSVQLYWPGGGGKVLNLPKGHYWMGVLTAGKNNVVSIGADTLKNSGALSRNPPSNPFGTPHFENYYLAVNAVYYTGNH
jgi:hypothetical protein